MPLLGVPAPPKRKKSTKLITEITHDVLTETEPEVGKLYLGKKISVPRDIMLEELSLQNNKGSKMFKNRQMRVERFIYENNPDIFIAQGMDDLPKFIPGPGGRMGPGYSVVDGRSGQTLITSTTDYYAAGGRQLHPPVPLQKPGEKGRTAAGGGAGQHGGSGGSAGDAGGVAGQDEAGQGGEGGDAKSGGKTSIHIIKTYISPWERAMGNDAELKATMRLMLSAPGPRPDLLKYKCFNRTAIPYGGFEKASKLMTFQMPEFEPSPPEPECIVVFNQDVNVRPSFNRTPIPWVGSGEHGSLNIEISVPAGAETEEL
ncbi:myozenin-1 [Protopterus annectens]|uniref:myozenin-1 n=1 Tax=Protopterus annectens TaxID=7888 RepID=UPI001CFBD4C4|nr:myozenin-1 [Protopterus annectens]